MRLGLLADIHEDVERLAAAIARCRREGVDRLLTLGGNFAAFPHRRMFVGHFHRWLAVTPDGPLSWSGDRPITFDPDQRYLVVVAAVCDGWCAIYDTENDVLTPCDLRGESPR